ncbi:MAG TPA: hypothetical protein VGC22_06540 [Chitinophaga sp.]
MITSRWFKPVIATVFFLLALFLGGANGMAGRQGAAKGKRLYVHLMNTQEHASDVKQHLVAGLQEWGYWKLVDSRKEADVILNLNVQSHRGVTAWSWGGVTVRASATLEDMQGQTIWQSREYKANPNGTNGFNTARATANKIINEMKKQYR